jgi:hypothetical protein
MSYIILRGCWCDIVVLNVHVPTEDKIYDLNDSFYKEVKCVFDKFPKFRMKILLLDINAKVGREDIFKPTAGNESLHELSNGNVVGIVNFTLFKNLSEVLWSQSITFINLLGCLLMERLTIKL